MNTQPHFLDRSRAAKGFSLVELLVCVVIGLVLTLAVTSLMSVGESFNRGTIATNDTNQTGAHVAYTLDRSIRNAGSGFMQAWHPDAGDALGCRLDASRDGQTILPLAQALPAPFASVPLNVRLAPVVIVRDDAATSDVLLVMSGTGGFAETGRPVIAESVTVGATHSVDLVNTLGFQQEDIILLTGNGLPCMVQQVATGFTGSSAQTLQLGGNYFRAQGTDVDLEDFDAEGTHVVALGNISGNAGRHNPPQFHAYGVDANNVLVVHDLLLNAPNEHTPMADGVVTLRALYGIDENNDGIRDSWAAPTDNYAHTAMLAGNAQAKALLRRVVSVRFAVVLRSALVEREAVSPDELTLFQDLDESLQITVETNPNLRYRVIETTVPLINVVML